MQCFKTLTHKEQRPKVEQTPTAPPNSSAQTTLPEQQKKFLNKNVVVFSLFMQL